MPIRAHIMYRYREENIKPIEGNTERIVDMVDTVRLAILLIEM